jgi:hypothetical protein
MRIKLIDEEVSAALTMTICTREVWGTSPSSDAGDSA